MPVTITVGTNSYISLADANTYFNARLYCDAWTTSTDDNKSKALLMATAKIDRQRLKGEKVDDSQTLQFPREIFVGRNYMDAYRGEGWYTEDAISQDVKNATCEEALKILQNGASANQRLELQQQGVKRFKLGNLEEEYNGTSSTVEKLLSLEARLYLKKYLSGVAPIC